MSDKDSKIPIKNDSGPSNAPKFLLKLGITLACIGGLVWALLAAVPEGVDMSLEKIGQGQPAVVFIYDPNFSISVDQVSEINDFRSRNTIESIHFLVAKLGYPDTAALMTKHSAKAPEILFFDGQGNLVHRTFALIESSALGSLIQQSF